MDQQVIADLEAKTRQCALHKDFGREAEQLNRGLIQLSPRNLGAMNRLAMCLEKRNACVEAAGWCRSVLAVDPTNRVAIDRLRRMDAPGPTEPGSDGLDPASERDAEMVIRALYPDETELHTCLSRLADSIRLLNHLPTDHWMISLERNQVRFNASRLNCLSFERAPRVSVEPTSLLTLLCDYSKVPVEVRDLSFSLGGSRGPRPRSATHLDWMLLPSRRLDTVLPRCQEPHRAAVLEASQFGRSPYLRAHSRGVVAFMNRILGIRIVGP